MTKSAIALSEEFSLVEGGPLYQLMLRTKLVQPQMGRLPRRILACLVVTWLPLAVLTTLAGTLLGGVEVPFLFDDVQVQFLISLPILIGVEVLVHRRMRVVVGGFFDRDLVATADRPMFEALIAQVMRMRNSVVVELLLLVFAFTGGHYIWHSRTAVPVATWYATPIDGTIELTTAGYWFAFISLPIARFILLRWYYRLIIWYVFAWRVARLPLRLNPLHPDRAGGLGFLEHSITAFTPVLFAQSVFLSGAIAGKIMHTGARLPDFKFEIAGFVAILVLQVLLPLTFFVFQLTEAKLIGSQQYGRLASCYVNEFRRKWLQGNKDATQEPLLGSPDIQSLADLANGGEVVRTMRVLPFDRGAVIRLLVMIALPLLPLTLTMVPLDELFTRLVQLLM